MGHVHIAVVIWFYVIYCDDCICVCVCFFLSKFVVCVCANVHAAIAVMCAYVFVSLF